MEKKVVLHQVKHSPSSIFTKEDVIDLIEQIEIETITKLIMGNPVEQKPYMMSLYDYLGRAAGKELGAQVCATATMLKETIKERNVSNPKYTGKVLLYRREFLDEYFGNKIYEGEKKK